MTDRNIFRGENSTKFKQRFKDDNNCLDFLAEVKWLVGYEYKRCNNDKFGNGKNSHNRRFTKFRYDESPTAGAMFQKLKFSILIAFHIVFKIGTKKKGMSSIELSNEFELRQMTCCAFKQKLQQLMKSSLKIILAGVVHVDEFVIGGPEEGEKRRSKGLKKLIVLAVEIVEDEFGRAYAEVIEHSSAVELGGFLMKYVSREAEVVSDKWKGYTLLKKEFKNLKQVDSENEKNFKELHINIMNINVWLRGIHHHCNIDRL